MHLGPAPGLEKEVEVGDEEDDDEYAVRQPIGPHDDEVSDSVLVSFTF